MTTRRTSRAPTALRTEWRAAKSHPDCPPRRRPSASVPAYGFRQTASIRCRVTRLSARTIYIARAGHDRRHCGEPSAFTPGQGCPALRPTVVQAVSRFSRATTALRASGVSAGRCRGFFQWLPRKSHRRFLLPRFQGRIGERSAGLQRRPHESNSDVACIGVGECEASELRRSTRTRRLPQGSEAGARLENGRTPQWRPRSGGGT
jgi:hypothetical protein